MAACTTNMDVVRPDECINDSLLKINNNFINLESIVCDIKQRADSIKQVRTFFFYGPNAENDPTSGMANHQVSRPSDLTIYAFVNSTTELNLTAISRPGDIAYVIYQKTGFLNSIFQNGQINTDYRFGTVQDPQDVFNQFSPIFVIWRLTMTGTEYVVDAGFPKFSRAQRSQGNANNWNRPETWTTY